MNLDADTCYGALSSRDARFDGLFFVGVTTTGVYCRPVCAARTPRRERCTYFRTAAEADRAGFRACFRCRPELAPGSAILDAVPRLASRAVGLIEDGFLNDHDVAALAAKLDVSERHLRRAMEQHLGVSPLELAQSRRLALAKQLLHDTELAIVEVAHASGFRSVRRFNALFRSHFGVPPTGVRRAHGKAIGGALTLRLEYRAPFAWDEMLAFFAGRAIAGVEQASEDEYRRVIAIEGHMGIVSVTHDGRRLIARVAPSLTAVFPRVVRRLRALFDLDARPDAIALHLARDRALAPHVRRCPGLRVPGAVDVFEIAVRAVLGQQVSVRAARTLAGRLVARFGAELPPELAEDGLTHSFPAPAAIAAASIDELAAIGLPGKRAASLRELAQGFSAGSFSCTGPSDSDALARELVRIDGIGEWTARYVSMRALSDPDAFVASDLGVKKALGGVSAKEAEARSARWSPWRAYAVMHLWRSLS